jgi:hypothetical protein
VFICDLKNIVTVHRGLQDYENPICNRLPVPQIRSLVPHLPVRLSFGAIAPLYDKAQTGEDEVLVNDYKISMVSCKCKVVTIIIAMLFCPEVKGKRK